MFDPNIFQKNDNYYEHLGANVWLMDNHIWALYVWDKNRLESGLYRLVHVDYHWDAGYDFWENADKEKELIEASKQELKNFIEEGRYIKYDSFIGPALARKIINDIHFLCFQEDEDDGFYQPVLDKFGCQQTIHLDSKELRSLVDGAPLIFDFCLDVFNRSDYEYASELWSNDEIEELLKDCKEIIKEAHIVTVSMSYGYSGTLEDTKMLTGKVVPVFMKWRCGS